MLHYGDVDDDIDNPPIETLQEKSELKAGPKQAKTNPDWLVLCFTRFKPCLTQSQ